MPSSQDGANAIASGVSLAPISAGLAEPAVRHDQLNLLVLDRVTPHFAAIGVNSAVPVDPVERGGADAHHHQWLLARCLEPVEGAVRQKHAFVLADRAGLVVWPIESRFALQDDKGVVLVRMGVQTVLTVCRIGL